MKVLLKLLQIEKTKSLQDIFENIADSIC
jgi:hypothetical protein